jgi:hypothetical protein
LVRSHRAADRRPTHDRSTRAIVMQQAQAGAARVARTERGIEEVPQSRGRIFYGSHRAVPMQINDADRTQ